MGTEFDPPHALEETGGTLLLLRSAHVVDQATQTLAGKAF